ncbi:hypothetical protein BOW53_16305, partial [Solemya pervernicosa gill symbiont]
MVLQKLSELYNLTSLLVDKGIITGDLLFPDKPNSSATYKVYKAQAIPAEHLSKIKPKKRSADEEFYDTLSRTCSAEIAESLKAHVYNFKNVKHHTGESLFLRKLVLGVQAQASGKYLTRPFMPTAPR